MAVQAGTPMAAQGEGNFSGGVSSNGAPPFGFTGVSVFFQSCALVLSVVAAMRAAVRIVFIFM